MKMDWELGARWLVLGVDGGRRMKMVGGRRMSLVLGGDVLRSQAVEEDVLGVGEDEWIAALVVLQLTAR